MIPKRKLLMTSVFLLTIFVLTTYYLLTILTASESEVRIRVGVHEQIYKNLQNLPELYKKKSLENDARIDKIIKNINTKKDSREYSELWKIANSWVSKTKIVDFESEHLGNLLLSLKEAKIIKADLDTRGTQLKFFLTLEGNQNVVFKPKWYEKERIIEGAVYAGKDRYGSEVIAFYLSILLNIPFTPPSVERIVSLSKEILPVASKRLINTSFEHNNRTCIYGKCFYCKREDPICEDNLLSSHGLYGAVIFNINTSFKSNRSPWQRTYKKGKKAAWEESNNYCKTVKEKLSKKRLLDLIDVSIFDFLIQNGDRHHYETLYDNVILLDNGKGFGNPHFQHLDILAPLYQCCTLRSSTMKNLQSLSDGVLRKKLELLPNVQNLLTTYHLKAMEERLLIVFSTVEYCRNRNKSIY